MEDKTHIMSLAAWEQFKEELLRNLSPNKRDVEQQIDYLVVNNLCDQDIYEKLIHTRLMASYEAGINQYLHPPLELKQANIKAEIIHIGTIVEALLKILIKNMVARNIVKIPDVKSFAKQFPKSITFKQMIDFINASTDIDEQVIKKLHELRDERNKVHIEAIKSPSFGDLSFEEYRVIEYRNKLDFIINEIKRILGV